MSVSLPQKHRLLHPPRGRWEYHNCDFIMPSHPVGEGLWRASVVTDKWKDLRLAEYPQPTQYQNQLNRPRRGWARSSTSIMAVCQCAPCNAFRRVDQC